SRFFEPPISGLVGRALGLDAVEEVAFGIELEDAHAIQLDSLLAARFGVEDRLAVLALLAQPERPPGGAAETSIAAGQLGFDLRRSLAQHRRDRIVDPGQRD